MLKTGLQSVVDSIRTATQERRDFLRNLKKNTAHLMRQAAKNRIHQSTINSKNMEAFREDLARFTRQSKRQTHRLLGDLRLNRRASSSSLARRRKADVGMIKRSVRKTLLESRLSRRRTQTEIEFATKECLRRIHRRVKRLQGDSKTLLNSFRLDRFTARNIWNSR